MRWRDALAEKRRDRDAQSFGDLAQITDRGFGKVAFDLAQPPDRPAQLIAKSSERQATRLANGAQVSAERRGLGWCVVQHAPVREIFTSNFTLPELCENFKEIFISRPDHCRENIARRMTPSPLASSAEIADG